MTSETPDVGVATAILEDAAKIAQLSIDSSVAAKEAVISAATAVQQKQITNDDMKNVLVDALNQVFGEKEDKQQFINISRVPMICVQVQKIHSDIEEIKLSLSTLDLVKKIVFGMAGIVLTGFVVNYFMR